MSGGPADKGGAPRWRRWLIDVLIVLLVLGAVQLWRSRDMLRTAGDTPAPTFTLPDLDGHPVSLQTYRGQTVMLHFWATWCGVCRAELGSLERLHQRLGEDVVLVTVAVNSGDAATVRAFAEERGLTFPILLDNDRIASTYRVAAFPTTYWISPSGKLTSSAVGFTSGPGMRWRLWRASRR